MLKWGQKSILFFRVSVILIITYLFLVAIKLMGYEFRLFGKNGSIPDNFLFRLEPESKLYKPTANSIAGLLGSNATLMLVLSIAALFLSLRYFVKVMKPIAQSEFKHLLNKHIFSKPIRAFSFGALLTILVQSSSVTTSFIVPMAGVGIFGVETIFPYVLGVNIGTTFTALMVSAVIVALAHLLFNIFGCMIVYPLRMLPISLSKYLANISLKSRLIPFAYIVAVFYIIPVLEIIIFS